jgi:DNA-binding MarR family transcriptional regulator
MRAAAPVRAYTTKLPETRPDSLPMPTEKPLPARAGRAIDMRYLEGTVGYSIRRAQMAVFQDIYASFGDKAVTLVQFSVMAVAADNPGITQWELAEVLAVERPRMVPVLNQLEALGLAQRQVCERDKRSRRIVLTPAGKKRLAELKRRFAAHEARLERQLGEHTSALLDTLHRLGGLGRAQPPASPQAAKRPGRA